MKRTTKLPTPSEHQEQAALFAWAKLAAARLPELRLLFAVPNGGARDAVTGARLKAEGVKPGIPDVCLPVARGGWIGLWIEMKTSKRTLKPHQRAIGEALAAQGHRVAVCWGWESARAEILEYLAAERRGGAGGLPTAPRNEENAA